MKYAHILESFYGQAWHLRSDTWQRIDSLLQRASVGEQIAYPAMRSPRMTQVAYTAVHATSARPIVGPLDPDTGQPVVPQMQVLDSLAIIPVYGILGHRLSLLQVYCGGCDYRYISEFSAMAQQDPAIQRVIYDFDSPGGASRGCIECARDIAAVTAVKETIGYSEGMACSAAYGLASACGSFGSSETAVVGNIGTILCGEDNSGQWAQQGRVPQIFASSPRKATGAEGKPWTDDDRAYLQERMQQTDARFKDSIRAGRPQLQESAMDGSWFYGANAQSLGLVDFLARDLDELIAALNAA